MKCRRAVWRAGVGLWTERVPIAVGMVAAGFVVLLSLVSCSRVPCPIGQEQREDRHDPTDGWIRGCVGRDADGTYRREGRWEFLYVNGLKGMEGTYHNGKKEGVWTTWYENGLKGMEETYRDGKLDGAWTTWYENGQRDIEATYREGKLDGVWTCWYENGQKWMEVTFSMDEIVPGLETVWDDKGRRTSTR